MLSHKINLGSKIGNIVLLRSLHLHFQGREKKIEGTFVFFNYNGFKDDTFFAEWDLFQLIEANL